MKAINNLITAFSLYSAIPTPRIAWNTENMQYALCFFPLVGLVIGLVQLGWTGLCSRLEITSGLYAAGATLLPLLLSGGIHMDGFMDTMDALGSHAALEKKLEILKDPHIGSFGVLGCVCVLLLHFGLWGQVYGGQSLLPVLIPSLGFIISRALNALSISTFACAKASGLVWTFSEAAAKKAVTAVSLFYLLVCACILLFLHSLSIILIVWLSTLFARHKRFVLSRFGGNTGDLAGFLTVIIELCCLTTGALISIF